MISSCDGHTYKGRSYVPGEKFWRKEEEEEEEKMCLIKLV